MSVNVGDKNIARDILYEDIRVETITHGKLLDVQVKCIPDYNPASGREIKNVVFRNIRCDCIPSEPSVVAGYDADHVVCGARLENVTAGGKPIQLEVGEYAFDIISDV